MRPLLPGAGGRPLIIGHRGAMGHAPENTMASFQKGLEQGVDLIELDVHLSKDGHLVVIHDHRLERTTNGKGLVGEHTLAGLKALDAGSWYHPSYAGERIPTLEEVLAWAQGRVPLVIEIKGGPAPYEGIAAQVVEVVAQAQPPSVVISFDHAVVREVAQRRPELMCGVLYACRPVDSAALARGAQAQCLLPHWSFVLPEVVAQAHQAGLWILPWVVDDPQAMARLIAMGVDGLGTNYPDRLRRLLEEGEVGSQRKGVV